MQKKRWWRASGLLSSLRFLVALFVAFLGVSIVYIVAVNPPAAPIGAVVSGIGISAIVTGVMSLFREMFIKGPETEEVGAEIAGKVFARLAPFLPDQGFHMLAPERRGMPEYYTWTSTPSKKLVFAGISVLHRMQADLHDAKDPKNIEDVIVCKLREGCEIQIMFMAPTCNLINRIAKEEGQMEQELLQDIDQSLVICKSIYERLGRETGLNNGGKLYIRLYNSIPHFAYHRDDEDVIVGFYFRKHTGSGTPALRVLDRTMKIRFEEHFKILFDDPTTPKLVEFGDHSRTPVFDHHLHQDFRAWIADRLNELAGEAAP